MGTEPRLVEVELEEPPQTIPTTAETRTTLIRLKRAKKLIRALLRGLHFDTDKAFLLPGALKGIAMLRRFLAPRPGLSLLIVGHADTQGAAAHNLKLSEERARSIHHFLRDDVDAWLAFYGAPASSKPWGRIEDQHMLSALPGGGAPAFYAGPIHGKDDEPTKAAVKAFQRFSNETRGTTLSDDGICGPLTRRELVASYMGLDGQTLPAETVVVTHGCGESHPEVATGDGVALEENRRVEVFLFDGPAAPPPVAPCPSPAGCAEYPVWREETRFTIDLSQDPKDVTVKVQEDDGAIPEADVRLVGVDARAGKTDAAGTLLFAMVIPGEYEVAADKAGFHPNKVPLVVGGGGGGGAKAKPQAPDAGEKSLAEAPAGDADAPAGDGGDAVVTLEAKPGLTLFEIVSAPENSGILLDPKTRLPMVEPVPGRPGPTPAVDKNATGTVALMVNHRPRGTAVRLRWATEGKVTVLLTIQRDGVAQFLDAQGQPRADLPPTVGPVVRGNDKVKTDGDRIVFDVTALGDGKTKDDPATFDIVEDCLFTFDASLLVVEATGDPDPTKRKPVARSFVRLMRKLQDPKILDMAVLNQRTNEKVTSFKDWRDLGFEFSLNDTSVGNDLVISGTIIKEGRPPTPAFTRETLKKADERRLRGASAPGQFAQFAPDVPAPYDLELDAELRPAGDHWPAKGTKVRIHFDPKQDQQPDLISIHEALALPNGSPIDLRAKGPVRSKAWVKTTTTAPVPAKGALDSPSNPVWSWTLEKDPQGGKVVVTDVRARVRDLHYAAYQVLERVEWEPVTIRPKGAAKAITLPYDPQFFLELTTAEDGFHGGDAPGLDQTGHYWKLQFHLDKSFQLVFGYEVIGEAVRPLNRAPGADPLDAKLFPRCPRPAPAGTIAGSAKVPDGEPLRVCVVVSLVTHRENSKFAPGDLLGAGRIYPYGLVLSSRELERATHRVSTKRPDRTATPLAGVDGIVPSSCCIEMHEEMGAVLFTDNNVLRFPLIVGEVGPGVSLILEKLRNAAGTDLYNKLPMWNNFFDWYDTEPVNEDFRAVTRVATPATVPNAIGVLKFPKMIFLPGVGLKRLKDEEYARIDVLKVARQGEYDNIHQAPKMFMPSSVKTDAGNLKRFANAPEVGEPGKAGTTPMWGVEHVSMAPVCVHDCFHTHWRWSKDFDFQFTKGWGRGFNPYEVAGGALIPENQTLRVQFSGRGTLGLATAIHGVEAGRWQVANHFGSAYALHMNAPEEAVTNGINHAAELLEEPLLDGFPKFGLATSWARFYWRLRFGGTSTRPQERLKVTAAERTTLRLANLGPEES